MYSLVCLKWKNRRICGYRGGPGTDVVDDSNADDAESGGRGAQNCYNNGVEVLCTLCVVVCVQCTDQLWSSVDAE